MRKLFLFFTASALMLGAIMSLSSADTNGVASPVTGESNPGNEANAIQALYSFRTGFAHIADGVMETLNSVWLTGGEGTRCFLGFFFMLTFILALIGIGAINSIISAYKRYIG